MLATKGDGGVNVLGAGMLWYGTRQMVPQPFNFDAFWSIMDR